MPFALWDAAYEALPPITEDISQGAERITTFKEAVRDRAETEHNWGSGITAGNTDDGRHNPGSARVFYGAVAPTNIRSFNNSNHGALVGGGSSVLGVNDEGRLWLDESTTPATLMWWDGTAWQATTSGGGGAVGSSPHKNHLINGNFEVWQRAFASVAIPIAANTYRADRWFVRAAGAATGTQVRDLTTLPAGAVSRAGIRLTGGAGVTTVDLVQRIEAATTYLLTQGVLTVSFQLRYDNGAAGTVTPSLLLGTPTVINNFATVNNQLTQAHATAVSDGQLVWANINVSGFADIANGLEVRLRFPAGSLDNVAENLTVTDAQLELNASVSPFEFRPFAVELPLCQRYYEKTFAYATVPNDAQAIPGALITRSGGANAAERDIAHTWTFNTPKVRVGYTMAFFTPLGPGPGVYRNITDGADSGITPTATVGGSAATGDNGVAITNSTGAAGADQNDVMAIHATADAEL